MKIIVNVASLYQGVTKLLTLSQQSYNKILIAPTESDTAIRLYAGNPASVYGMVEIAASVEDFDEPTWVEAQKLYSFTNAIHNIPNATIVNAAKKWKFSIGSASFSTNTTSGEAHYQPLPDVPPIRIKANEVANLSRVASLSAKDRGFYSGTYLISSGKHLSCLATDGYGAGIVWFETDRVLEERKDFFIPSEALIELKKAINHDSDVFIYSDVGKVHFVSDEFRLITTEIADKAKFPADRIAEALRVELTEGLETYVTDLIDKLTACSSIKDIDHNNALRVNIKAEDVSTVTITSFDNHTKMVMKAPIIKRFGTEEINFDINPRYIQTATGLLKQLGELATVYIYDAPKLNWVFVTANGINGRFAFAKMHPQ